MSKLVEYLYPVPDYRRTPITLLRWWESRRIFYNEVVGATGLVTIGGVCLLTALPPHGMAIPWMGVLALCAAYGVAANVFYTLGWGLEVLAAAIWGREAPEIGPVLFRQGLIFSVGLTLFPLMIAALLWVLRVVMAVAG